MRSILSSSFYGCKAAGSPNMREAEAPFCACTRTYVPGCLGFRRVCVVAVESLALFASTTFLGLSRVAASCKTVWTVIPAPLGRMGISSLRPTSPTRGKPRRRDVEARWFRVFRSLERNVSLGDGVALGLVVAAFLGGGRGHALRLDVVSRYDVVGRAVEALGLDAVRDDAKLGAVAAVLRRPVVLLQATLDR